MVAYSFNHYFIEAVRSGIKRQTIRPIGKRRHARPGEPVQLYTGMRTATCSKIVETDPICTGCHKIEIEIQAFDAFQKHGRAFCIDSIKIDGQEVDSLSFIAWSDGFADLDEMAHWFGSQYGAGTFTGVMITWEAPK